MSLSGAHTFHRTTPVSEPVRFAAPACGVGARTRRRQTLFHRRYCMI